MIEVIVILLGIGGAALADKRKEESKKRETKKEEKVSNLPILGDNWLDLYLTQQRLSAPSYPSPYYVPPVPTIDNPEVARILAEIEKIQARKEETINRQDVLRDLGLEALKTHTEPVRGFRFRARKNWWTGADEFMGEIW